MSRIARAPPVAGLALAIGSGAAAVHLGVSLPSTLLPFSFLLLLIPAFHRPSLRVLPLFAAVLSGIILTHAWTRTQASDCRFHLPDGEPLHVRGRSSGPFVDGRGELRVRASGPRGCNETMRMVLGPGMAQDIPGGTLLSVHGVWRSGGKGSSGPPLWAGYLRGDSLGVISGKDLAGRKDPLGLLGGRVQSRLGELYPTSGGLATALVWARKDGIEPQVREAFARAGTAHLLAISGFHVGVVAGLLLLMGGMLGLPHSLRSLVAASGVWVYVLAIGVPDAALRAALILSVLAVGRLVGRSVAPLGALGTAFLLFLALDPGALLRPGFQLSFAGALGLVTAYAPISNRIGGWTRDRMPPFLRMGLAAGMAATWATLPIVAWHFGRVSLVGIPMTLLVAPLVALAIPGILATLLLHPVFPALAGWLALGVDLDLMILTELVEGVARFPLASVWVSRASVVAGVAGLFLGLVAVRARPGRGGLKSGARMAIVMAATLLMGPLAARFLNRGVVELVALDVGQGDALLLRSPAGRWIQVDAGPRTRTFDSGARTVLPYLRRRGVGTLDLLVLTHPDMDHVGGASAILAGFPVRGIVDPGMAVGTEAYLDVLEAAGTLGIPWEVMAAGDSLNVDGMALRVLSPRGEGRGEVDEDDGANASSLVLEVRYGEFAALLTGDAPSDQEIRLLPQLLSPRFQVLKVGHHGSSTSTAPELLNRVRPQVALISVGRRNRYGHPHSEVLRRLRGAGARIFRTDRQGTLVVRGRRDGSVEVSPGFPD